MKMLLENKDLLGQVAGQFGLGQQQAQSAMKPMLGNLSAAFNRNTQQQGGLEQLLGTLQKGKHQRYVDNYAELQNEQTTQDGNGILGHLFGSKEVSRQVAAKASQQSGVDSSILKKMLPVLASAAMGMLSKQESSNNLLSGLLGGGSNSNSGGGGGMLDMAASLFDSDGDGSVVDDVLGGLAKKFLG